MENTDSPPLEPRKALWWVGPLILLITFTITYHLTSDKIIDSLDPTMLCSINHYLIFIGMVTAWVVLWRRTMDSPLPVLRALALLLLCLLLLPSFFSDFWNALTTPFTIPALAAIVLFSERHVEPFERPAYWTKPTSE